MSDDVRQDDERSLWTDVGAELSSEPPLAKSLGSQRVKEVHVEEIFPERNQLKLIHRVTIKYNVRARTRFIERQHQWSGAGVKSRPRVDASVDGRPLSASVHGRPWIENKVEAYLIDLGETILADAELTVVTEQTFIDESEAALPYLSHRNFHEYDDFTMSIVLKDRPASAVYSLQPFEGDEDGIQEENFPLAPHKFGDDSKLWRIFHSPDGSKRGIHRISWVV
ncbi:hypothetical protein [Rathayibacter sp. AY1B5]|uniref:hypothetical protein n=1 Tax=Rathayibacter sp. AY1B5 TaxID=2080530 RepID=UPI0011B08095|nr:hypothetical protein [Rathayibacter sp. AY1B5]